MELCVASIISTCYTANIHNSNKIRDRNLRFSHILDNGNQAVYLFLAFGEHLLVALLQFYHSRHRVRVFRRCLPRRLRRVDDSYRKVEDMRAALEADRDQLWAEAVQRWKDGEKLCLPKELETGIRQIQEEHNDDADDPIPGMIDEYLSIKLPVDWYAWDINRRRAYIKNPDPLDATGTETRTRVCAQGFLTEYMGYDKGNPNTKYMGRKFNRYMETKTKEWEKCKTIIAGYGPQKAWRTKAAVRPEKLSPISPKVKV